MQRRIERSIRKQTRLRNAYEAAGLEDDAQSANIKLRRLKAKYTEFSKAAGLPEQSERMKVLYTDAKSEAAAASRKKAARTAEFERLHLQNQKNAAILKEKIDSCEIPTKIRHQVQARHMEGTPEFERYRTQRLEQGKTPQSILTITEQEAQELVDKYACTGTVEMHMQKNGALKFIEYKNVDVIVGMFYSNDEYRTTKRISIFYSKKGTHVVPTDPEGEKK